MAAIWSTRSRLSTPMRSPSRCLHIENVGQIDLGVTAHSSSPARPARLTHPAPLCRKRYAANPRTAAQRDLAWKSSITRLIDTRLPDTHMLPAGGFRHQLR